jgi:hypothetical protein
MWLNVELAFCLGFLYPPARLLFFFFFFSYSEVGYTPRLLRLFNSMLLFFTFQVYPQAPIPNPNTYHFVCFNQIYSHVLLISPLLLPFITCLRWVCAPRFSSVFFYITSSKTYFSASNYMLAPFSLLSNRGWHGGGQSWALVICERRRRCCRDWFFLPYSSHFS